ARRRTVLPRDPGERRPRPGTTGRRAPRNRTEPPPSHRRRRGGLAGRSGSAVPPRLPFCLRPAESILAVTSVSGGIGERFDVTGTELCLPVRDCVSTAFGSGVLREIIPPCPRPGEVPHKAGGFGRPRWSSESDAWSPSRRDVTAPGRGRRPAATGRRDEGGDDGAGTARGAPGCGREQRPSSSPEGSRPAAAAVKHPR